MSRPAIAFLTFAALAVAQPAFAPQAYAQSKDSPILALGGNWLGNGSINFSDGHKERIRCRSDYSPDAAGDNMKINLVCASDSYKFELAANVQYQGGQISGMWNERTRNAAGNLSGKASPGNISVNAIGQTVAAILNISTQGDSQTVRIESPGSTVSAVTISMTRK